MADKYSKSQRIDKVKRDAIYNNHYYPTPPPMPIVAPMPPARSVRWGWVSGIGAAVALVGTMAATQLNARTPVYYCASHNAVKYHTDATCPQLQHCGARVKSMQLGKAKDKMELCKSCH